MDADRGADPSTSFEFIRIASLDAMRSHLANLLGAGPEQDAQRPPSGAEETRLFALRPSSDSTTFEERREFVHALQGRMQAAGSLDFLMHRLDNLAAGTCLLVAAHECDARALEAGSAFIRERHPDCLEAVFPTPRGLDLDGASLALAEALSLGSSTREGPARARPSPFEGGWAAQLRRRTSFSFLPYNRPSDRLRGVRRSIRLPLDPQIAMARPPILYHSIQLRAPGALPPVAIAGGRLAEAEPPKGGDASRRQPLPTQIFWLAAPVQVGRGGASEAAMAATRAMQPPGSRASMASGIGLLLGKPCLRMSAFDCSRAEFEAAAAAILSQHPDAFAMSFVETGAFEVEAAAGALIEARELAAASARHLPSPASKSL